MNRKFGPFLSQTLGNYSLKGSTTLIITTLGITVLGKSTLSVMTLSIMALGKMTLTTIGLIPTLSETIFRKC